MAGEDVIISVPVNGSGPINLLMQDPPAGAYEIEIQGVEQKTKADTGKTALHFSVIVTEAGEAQGVSTMAFIGTDWTKAFNVGHFTNLFTGAMERAGKTAEEIKAKLAGIVQLPISALKGRKAFLLVKEAPAELDEQGRKQFADKNFIDRAQYEQAKKTKVTLQSAGRKPTLAAVNGSGSTPPDPFGGGAPAAGGGPTPPLPGATGGNAAGAGASLDTLFG